MNKATLLLYLILMLGNLLSQSGLGDYVRFNESNVYFKSSDSLESQLTKSVRGDDTSRYFKKENTTHSLNFQLFGPLFISSIGYAWENKFNEKLSLQFDAKLLGHTNIGGAGAYARSYFIGSSLSQSLLIGNKFKFKLGFIEGLAFNPPSINGAYTELNYWDRPPRMVYFVSFVVGCEIRLYKQIYLIPDAIISYGAYTRIKGTPPFEEKYSISGFAPSFGITLKIKI